MKVVVGLGNPGPDYAHTRHNLGFVVIDRLAHRWQLALERLPRSLIAWTQRHGDQVVLLKPQTMMNRSGEALTELAATDAFTAGDVIVVHDDLDVELGRLKIRVGGGAGGHHGVESIVAALGSVDCIRLKLGVGRPPAGQSAVDHVLASATDTDAVDLAAVCERAADAVDTVLAEGVTRAMNRFNQREAVHGGSPL